MDTATYRIFEDEMLRRMTDSAHGTDHVYRVLHAALEIARHEPGVDTDLLIMACLLHDIGRAAQFADPALCHAVVGAEMARAFCLAQGLGEARAQQVADCVRTHRYRSDDAPQSLEAKILFDADKLDVTGAIGVARTLLYQGHVGTPLYSTDADGRPLDGSGDEPPGFFQEYCRKLRDIYDRFYTKQGAAMAARRRQAAARYRDSLLEEAREVLDGGPERLAALLK